MNQKKKFRNSGAIGAFLDEYEKSLNELIETINDISEKELAKIIDFETNDEYCKSIQSILTHVVQSGYTYVVEIRKWLGEDLEYRSKMDFQTAKDYKYALKEMFEFNVNSINPMTARKQVFGRARVKGKKAKEFVQEEIEKMYNTNKWCKETTRGNWDKRNIDMYDGLVMSLFEKKA